MSEPLGIIYPPPDLRKIVDNTAKYVAKNGSAFEERIKREHKDKPKFSFLFQDDPFNAYYQHKVSEIRTSLLAVIEQGSQDAPAANANSNENDNSSHDSANVKPPKSENDNNKVDHDKSESGFKSVTDQKTDDQTQRAMINPDTDHNAQLTDDQNLSDYESKPRVRAKLADYIEEMNVRLEEPPTLNYLSSPAPPLTYMECDIIKLTSQYIATYGRSFLLDLVSREHNNIEFDFIKPQHGQFNYMTNLIMQYALIQNQPLDITEQLEKDATSQKHVLDNIRMRAEWTKMLQAEQKKKEEEIEKEKSLYAQIDWQDFVIVETIDYQPDEEGEFPPTTSDQVGTRFLIQQRLEENRNGQEEMDIDSDEEEDDSDEEPNRMATVQKSSGYAIPDALPPKYDNLPIRKDYDPKAASRTTYPSNYFVSPITSERVTVDKIHEHVRYNLSDPRHLEKKDQMLREKMNEETVFASGSQIQNSLKSLAERRTDIFGMNDQETAIGRRIGEEEQAQSTEERFIWDGLKSSLKKKKLG